LVEKEKYLPSTIGTRGFVDIVAKDTKCKLILIELKRSNATSREALHEILKYVEGVKENLSVREDELRVIVVSTEWAELLVPFSSFASRVNFSLLGLRLLLDPSLKPIGVHRIEVLPFRNDRMFAPWHELNMHTDQSGVAKCIKSYEASCTEKGIQDYVLVEMDAHPDRREMEIKSVMEATRQLGQGPGMSRDEVEREVTCLNHNIYFAPLMLSDEHCKREILRLAEEEDAEEFNEWVAEMEGEDLTCALHEKLYDTAPNIHRGHFEIGYPAKFGITLIDDEKWAIRKIHRYGTLAANTLLTDEVIIKELRGETGATGQKYIKKVDLSDPGEIASLRSEIQNRFDHNSQIIHQLLYCIDDAIRSKEGNTLHVSIFQPSFITLSIFKFATTEDGMLSVPSSTIGLLGPDNSPIRAYCITLEPNGRTPSFSRMMDRFYEGDPWRLLFNLQWGGFDANDPAVCDEIGLSYEVSKVETHTRRAYRLVNFNWQKVERVGLFEGLIEFMNSNEPFVDDIVSLYRNNWNGFMVSYDHQKGFGDFKT